MDARIREVLIAPTAAIRTAMAAIDRGSMEIALVVDSDDRLLGTLTDGDIRRAILGGADLSDEVEPHMTTSPTVVGVDHARGEVLELMRSRALGQVPIVDNAGRVVGIHVMQDLLVPLSVPTLSGNAVRYVNECLSTNFVSSVGPFVERFEHDFASFVGAPHAVACSSGTAALHVALQLAGAGPGTEVAVSTFTFIASANAIKYTGASPLLVDSEPRTWNMNTQLLYDEVVRRDRMGSALPAVIEIVHLLGHPADMEPLVELRDRFGIAIVEDAAEALGATYVSGPFAGKQVGAIGNINCFSFNGNKIVTTGGGGMIVTDDSTLAAKARHLTTQAKLPGRGYEHDEIGYNYRLTNIAAALGVAQLEELPAFLATKRTIAERYDRGLHGLPVQLPPRQPWASPTYWLYTFLLNASGDRDRLLDELAAAGVQARPIWPPVHRQLPFAKAERLGGEVSEDLHARGISLPSSVALTAEDQRWVIDCLHRSIAQID